MRKLVRICSFSVPSKCLNTCLHVYILYLINSSPRYRKVILGIYKIIGDEYMAYIIVVLIHLKKNSTK